MIQYIYNNALHAFIEFLLFKIVFKIKADFQFD